MDRQYIEKQNQGYRIAGTRVSLDSVVFAFLNGLSPETIASECFPVLTLEQVYGAITYYLGHRAEIDAYLKQTDNEFEALRQITREPAFVQKMAAKEDRILVIHDRKTMHSHFAEFIMAERSPGVLIVPQKLSVVQVAEELILIWSASEPEEWVNKIRSLPF